MEKQDQINRDFAIATTRALAEYCAEIDLIELPEKVVEYFGGNGKITVSQDNQFPTTYYLQFSTEPNKPFLLIGTEPDFYADWNGEITWGVLDSYGGYGDIDGSFSVASPAIMAWKLFEQLNEKLGGN